MPLVASPDRKLAAELPTTAAARALPSCGDVIVVVMVTLTLMTSRSAADVTRYADVTEYRRNEVLPQRDEPTNEVNSCVLSTLLLSLIHI